MKILSAHFSQVNPFAATVAGAALLALALAVLSWQPAFAQAGWEATFAEQQAQQDSWQAQPPHSWQAQPWYTTPANVDHPYMYGWNDPSRWDGPTTFCAPGDAAVWDDWSYTWQCSSLQGSTAW